MLAAWRQFLETSGAVFQDHEAAHFGDPQSELLAAETGDVVADLSSTGLVAASGADAVTFLQGQLVSDVCEVSEQRSQPSGLCSIKGRLLASFRIIMRDGTYYLQLPRELADSLIQRLRLYVLRSNVKLEDASDRLVRLGFKGRAAAASVAEAFGELPGKTDQVHRAGGLRIVRVGGEAPRFVALGDMEESRRLWGTLAGTATPVGTGPWALTDIMAGVPTIQPETRDAFVPQMVNYQAIGGVSFSKGCYTGQEVVARTQHLGKLKRRMYLALVDTDTVPVPGDKVFAPHYSGDQGAGRVVNVQAHPQGGYALLAVVRMESAENDTLHLASAQGPALQLAPLPYTLAS